MPNSLFNSRRTHPAVIPSMYYDQHSNVNVKLKN